MKNNNRGLKGTEVITASALLTAACVVLSFLAKSIFGSGPLRFTVENLPVFFGSFLYGPAVGGVIALASDLLSCVFAGMTPFPMVSAGAFLTGVVSGIVYRLMKKHGVTLRVILSVMSGHIVGSMLIKSLALYPFYGISVLLRIPIYIGIAVIESAVLVFLHKNRSLMNQAEKMKDKK